MTINLYKKVFFGIFLAMVVLVSTAGRAHAAPKYITNITSSPSSPRQVCASGTPVDFAVNPSNVGFDLNTGVLTYDINLQWQRCTNENTRAYAVYSSGPEICPYSGIYGVGGWTTDCVKYIGSPPGYVGFGNGLTCWGGTNSQCVTGLTCWGGTNSQCVTSSFSGARIMEDQPSYTSNSISIPMSASNSLWAFVPANDTWTVTQQMCQFYKTGLNLAVNINRCVDVSISVTWATNVETSFDIKPKGQINLLPDSESPISSEFTNVGATTDRAVNGVVISRSYVIRRTSAPDQVLPSPASETVNIPTTGVNLDPNPDSRATPGLVAGDQVCVIVTVSPGSGTANVSNKIVSRGADKSEPFCVPVSNKPYVSFYSNDLAAGYGFDNGLGQCIVATDTNGGSVKAFNKKTPSGYQGSLAQLAIKALGNIDQVNSGATNSPTIPNLLSFSSDGLFGGNFGTKNDDKITPVQCISNYMKDYDATSTLNPAGTTYVIDGSAGNAIDESGAKPEKRVRVDVKGDLVIDRGFVAPIKKGMKIVVYVDGNVRIKNDIVFENGATGWASKEDIPSFYLIARGNISIQSNVTQLDGIYVAQPDENTDGTIKPPKSTKLKGRIFTCTATNGLPYAPAALLDNCNTQLTVYGSFAAQKIQFDRVKNSLRDWNWKAGEKWDSSNAAERFISSPETYLTKPNLTPIIVEDSKADFITSLPPIL